MNFLEPADTRPQDYHLLSGSYRLSLWQFLSAFKSHLVHQWVTDFGRVPKSSRAQAIQATSEHWKRVVLRFSHDRYRERYIHALARSICDLFESGVIPTDTLGDPRSLSELRYTQIAAYLDRSYKLWLSLNPDSSTELFSALSESVSPYYGVIYGSRDQVHGRKTYNFATWLQQRNLLRVSYLNHAPYLSEQTRSNASLGDLCLYPAMVEYKPRSQTPPRVLGENEQLNTLLDRSTEAFLDFDAPEDVVGLVQRLDEETLLKKRRRRDPVNEALKGRKAIGRYTDLFFYIPQVIRYVRVLQRDPLDSDNAEPAPMGLLFIASPSLPGLASFLGLITNRKGSRALDSSVDRAWESIHGGAIGASFHAGVVSLRDKMVRDLVSTELNSRTEVWAHDASNWGKSILRNLANAERFIDEPERISKYITTARINAYLLTLSASAQRMLAGNRKIGPLFDRSDLERCMLAVRLSYELLLHLQRDVLEDQVDVQLCLDWTPQHSRLWVEENLAECVGRASFEEILDLSKSGNLVFWSLALMREAVHNIMVISPNRIAGSNTISVTFRVESTHDAILLITSQRHFQYTKFDQPEGLAIANKLYGPTCAYIGVIEPSAPIYREFETTSKVDPRRAFEVSYDLTIKFFLQ